MTCCSSCRACVCVFLLHELIYDLFIVSCLATQRVPLGSGPTSLDRPPQSQIPLPDSPWLSGISHTLCSHHHHRTPPPLSSPIKPFRVRCCGAGPFWVGSYSEEKIYFSNIFNHWGPLTQQKGNKKGVIYFIFYCTVSFFRYLVV